MIKCWIETFRLDIDYLAILLALVFYISDVLYEAPPEDSRYLCKWNRINLACTDLSTTYLWSNLQKIICFLCNEILIRKNGNNRMVTGCKLHLGRDFER